MTRKMSVQVQRLELEVEREGGERELKNTKGISRRKKIRWFKKMAKPFKNWVLNHSEIWKQPRPHSSPDNWACELIFSVR